MNKFDEQYIERFNEEANTAEKTKQSNKLPIDKPDDIFKVLVDSSKMRNSPKKTKNQTL